MTRTPCQIDSSTIHQFATQDGGPSIALSTLSMDSSRELSSFILHPSLCVERESVKL